MPRVVLFSADPAPELGRLASQADTWSGEPLSLVLVSLYRVADLDGVDPVRPWPGSPGTTRAWTIRLYAYEEPASEARGRAAGQDGGRLLWDRVDGDAGLTPLLENADAFAALDESGVRAAFHLARQHRPPVATDGLVPALVELAARLTAGPAARTSEGHTSEDSGSDDSRSPRR